jgi:hypothetical protein
MFHLEALGPWKWGDGPGRLILSMTAAPNGCETFRAVLKHFTDHYGRLCNICSSEKDEIRGKFCFWELFALC